MVGACREEKRRDHLRKLGEDDKIILKEVLKKYSVRMWIGFGWLSVGFSSRFL
jgi:hypothetical protein